MQNFTKSPQFLLEVEKALVLVFEVTSMQEASGTCVYTEIVWEPLRLELNNTFSPEHVTDLYVLGNGMWSVAVDKFCVVRKKF